MCSLFRRQGGKARWGVFVKVCGLLCVSLLFWFSWQSDRFSCFSRSSTNEVKNLLQSLPRTSEPREMLFEDRTRAHADHIGQGFERQTTAAVGVLKAVCSGEGWAVKQHVVTLWMSKLLQHFLFIAAVDDFISSPSFVFSSEPPRVTKDVVCFHAGDFPYVVQRLQLDLYEPPLSQVLYLSHTHRYIQRACQ